MTKRIETWVPRGGTFARRSRTYGGGTTPPPTPTATTLFGFYPGDDQNGVVTPPSQDFTRISGYLGTPEVYRMFHSGTSGPPASFVDSDADYGPPVVVSFKLPPTQVTAGTHDSLLNGWFASIPTDRKVWWSYWHEPEDDIEGGSFTAAQYRAAWSHILTLAPARSTLRSALILMGFSLFKTSRVISDYVAPGLDCLFWDAYLTSTTKNIDGVITKTKASSDSFGLAYGITETSVATSYNYTGKTHTQTVEQYVPELITNARAANAEVVTWFETNKSDGDWRMRPYTNAVASWVNR